MAVIGRIFLSGKDVSSGVALGSALEPLIVIIYINELDSGVKMAERVVIRFRKVSMLSWTGPPIVRNSLTNIRKCKVLGIG